jgi:hypothetical protein
LRLNDLALLQIIACNDEVGGFHGFDPGVICSGIIASIDECFATSNLLKNVVRFSIRDHAPAL